MSTVPRIDEDVRVRRVEAAERLIGLLQCGCLPAGRVPVEQVLPIVSATPPHPVVAELIRTWGVEGLIERVVVCCRAGPAVQRGELRAPRLARRLDYALGAFNRDRHSSVDSPTIDQISAPPLPHDPPIEAVERYVTERTETLVAVAGRPLPTSDRSLFEDLLHASVDFAASVACQLPSSDRVLDLWALPSGKVPVGRRLLRHLRAAWPEVPDPTLTAVQRLIRFQLLDPTQTADTVEAAVARKWRSCYPALHRPVALCTVSQLRQRDYETSRWLRVCAARGNWAPLEAALADSSTPLALAA